MIALTETTRSHFDGGRLLVEISDWDGNLHVGLCPPSMPADERFQGGLFFNRGFELDGRILAPEEIRGERLRAWSLLIRPDLDLTPSSESGRVGQLYDLRGDPERNCFGASLLLPQDGLLPALTCLASRWRYLHLWVREGSGSDKGITDFSFSRAIPPRLRDEIQRT